MLLARVAIACPMRPIPNMPNSFPPKLDTVELRRGPAGPRAAANKRDALGGANAAADEQKHADLRKCPQ